MSAPQTAESGITLLPIRDAVAKTIEQLAQEQHADVSDVVHAALLAWQSLHSPADEDFAVAPRTDALSPEAAAYDRWFRAQVQAALDDPRPAIPSEVVEQEFAARRSALKQRHSLDI